MSDINALISHDAKGIHALPVEEHSQDDLSRCDGSRTPPDVQYEIMRRHKRDICIAEISRQVGCDHRTVKAVIENWGTAQHTLRLQAHRSQVVDSLILGMHSAAEKGKLDSILSLSDRLGITEAPKNANQTSVGVQVILNGGPAPGELSLAKVVETSEGAQNQVQTELGLISPVMNTSNSLDVKDLLTASVPHPHALATSSTPTVSQQDNVSIQASKCDVPTGGDRL